MPPANYSITWHQEPFLEISRYANNRGTEKGGDGEVNQKRSSSNILVLPWPHPNIKPIEIFFSYSQLNVLVTLRCYSFCSVHAKLSLPTTLLPPSLNSLN